MSSVPMRNLKTLSAPILIVFLINLNFVKCQTLYNWTQYQFYPQRSPPSAYELIKQYNHRVIYYDDRIYSPGIQIRRQEDPFDYHHHLLPAASAPGGSGNSQNEGYTASGTGGGYQDASGGSSSNNVNEWSTRKDRARFFLYPDHHDVYFYQEIIPSSKETLLASKYNPNFYPILIIHGFQGNYSEEYTQHIKNAYLQMAFFANVIMVDWSGLAQPGYKVIPNIIGYPSASKNAATIGVQVAEFLKFLIDHGALTDPTRAHIIGGGVASHIAGIAGDSIHEWTGKQLGRITGLDPFGLDYHLRSKNTRLDRNDAEFVDIIHTNKGRYGYAWSLGHVDFYVNGGGPKQPGCRTPIDFIRDITGLPGSCSHAQVYEFFTQSIYHKTLACKADSYKEFQEYNGIKCEEPLNFGQYASYLGRGDYYLEIDELTD